MILQRICIPNEKSENSLLYLRSQGQVVCTDESINMAARSSFTTDTYMNLFDLNQWKKYTNIDGWVAHIVYRGDANIKLQYNQEYYFISVMAITDTSIYYMAFETEGEGKDDDREKKEYYAGTHHLYLSPQGTITD